MGVELFHVDRQTDRRTDITKQIAAFHNFANGSNNYITTCQFLCFRVAVDREHPLCDTASLGN